MKIAILSRNESLYSTRRLVEAAESRGHEAVVVDYLRCYLNIAGRRPVVLLDGQPLDDFDGVIPRIGASHTVYGTAVVRQFQMIGVPCVNGAAAITRARDKLQCTQLLAKEGVALPATGFGHSFKDVSGVIDSLGGPPLVVKTLSGTQGIGVVLAENRAAAQSVISAFRSVNANILVQEFVREAGGADIRCFVVGGRVVAAMRRQAAAGEFRANIHRGATAVGIEPSAQERRLALRAAKIVGLGVAGVDLLPTDSGPVVLEVNSSPGLEGIEGATGVDVADCIIRRLERQAAARRELVGAV